MKKSNNPIFVYKIQRISDGAFFTGNYIEETIEGNKHRFPKPFDGCIAPSFRKSIKQSQTFSIKRDVENELRKMSNCFDFQSDSMKIVNKYVREELEVQTYIAKELPPGSPENIWSICIIKDIKTGKYLKEIEYRHYKPTRAVFGQTWTHNYWNWNGEGFFKSYAKGRKVLSELESLYTTRSRHRYTREEFHERFKLIHIYLRNTSYIRKVLTEKS